MTSSITPLPGEPESLQSLDTSKALSKPGPLRHGWGLPVAGWMASLGALLGIGIGVGYDVFQATPSEFSRLLIIGGLTLLTGAPWVLLGWWGGQVRSWAAKERERHEHH